LLHNINFTVVFERVCYLKGQYVVQSPNMIVEKSYNFAKSELFLFAFSLCSQSLLVFDFFSYCICISLHHWTKSKTEWISI